MTSGRHDGVNRKHYFQKVGGLVALLLNVHSSFRDVPLGAGPESIRLVMVMDSALDVLHRPGMTANEIMLLAEPARVRLLRSLRHRPMCRLPDDLPFHIIDALKWSILYLKKSPRR